MRRYARIYLTLLKINFSALAAYRSNFVNSMVSSIAWAIFSVALVVILTMRTDSAFGWKREEIILLTGAYSILIGVFHTLFSRNFERLSRLINFGQLDALLVKPADSQFLASFWLVNYTSLIRIPIGIALVWYLVSVLRVTVTAAAFAWFTLFLFVGIVLLYSIWCLVATVTIWFPRISNIVDLMYSVSSISRFPREMIARTHAFLFLILLPLAFIINAPVQFLLAKGTWIDAGMLLSFAMFFLLASRMFWRFALRHYTSAST